MKVPLEARWIIDRLKSYHYEGYVVGGCVRDSLLGRKPKDWDLCTNALVEEMIYIFEKEGKKVILTGARHGTVTVLLNGIPFEVTTYRMDGEYINHRKPEKVFFTKSIEEDLKRRDFTINAMAYSPEKGLIDIFGGKDDLKNGCIRCVGDPEERFHEDALRILRGIRFVTELDFKVYPVTLKAMKKYCFTLKEISKERIRDELVKILVAPKPSKGIKILKEIGFFSMIFPKPKGLDQEWFNMIDFTKPILSQRLAAFLHTLEEPENILRVLRFDNETIYYVKRLIKTYKLEITSKKQLKKLIAYVGKENTKDIFDLYEAYERAYKIGNSEKIKLFRNMFKEIIDGDEAIYIKDLKINGKDLIKIGVIQGPKIKEVLQILLEEVLEDHKRNNYVYLLNQAKNILKIK